MIGEVDVYSTALIFVFIVILALHIGLHKCAKTTEIDEKRHKKTVIISDNRLIIM